MGETVNKRSVFFIFFSLFIIFLSRLILRCYQLFKKEKQILLGVHSSLGNLITIFSVLVQSTCNHFKLEEVMYFRLKEN